MKKLITLAFILFSVTLFAQTKPKEEKKLIELKLDSATNSQIEVIKKRIEEIQNKPEFLKAISEIKELQGYQAGLLNGFVSGSGKKGEVVDVKEGKIILKEK